MTYLLWPLVTFPQNKEILSLYLSSFCFYFTYYVIFFVICMKVEIRDFYITCSVCNNRN